MQHQPNPTPHTDMKSIIILTFFAILALAHSSDSSDLEKASEGNSELPSVKPLNNASPEKETGTGDLDSAGTFIGIGFGGGWGRGYGGYGGGWGRGYGGYGGGWGRGYGGYGGYGGGWGRRRGWGWGK